MKMICINCPRGCEMDVECEGGNITVSGNACARGEAYAKRKTEDGSGTPHQFFGQSRKTAPMTRGAKGLRGALQY